MSQVRCASEDGCPCSIRDPACQGTCQGVGMTSLKLLLKLISTHILYLLWTRDHSCVNLSQSAPTRLDESCVNNLKTVTRSGTSNSTVTEWRECPQSCANRNVMFCWPVLFHCRDADWWALIPSKREIDRNIISRGGLYSHRHGWMRREV